MKYFLILIIIAFSQLLNAQLSQNIMIDSSEPNVPQDAPYICTSGSDIYVAWIRETTTSFGNICFSKSTDQGKTFSKGKVITSNGLINANYQRTGNMAVGSPGHIYFTWLEKNGDQTDVLFCMSSDGGDNFTTPKIVSDDGAKYVQDFPAIAADENDNIYISFIDTRDSEQGLSDFFQLYFTKSTDKGSTFSANKRMSFMPDDGGTCECCSVSMVVTKEGHLYTAFRSNINNLRDIFVVRSMDSGENFDSAMSVVETHWNISACPVTGPSLKLDKFENLHVSWRSRQEVFYSRLDYGKDKFGREIKVANSGNYPSIIVNKDNTIEIIYEDFNQSLNLYYCNSLNGGNTFNMSKVATDEMNNSDQQFVRMALDSSGKKYVVWQDKRNGKAKTFFAECNSVLSPVIPSQSELTSPQDQEQIEQTVNFKWSTPDNLGNAFYLTYELHINSSGLDTLIKTNKTTYTMDFGIKSDYSWYVNSITNTGINKSAVQSFSITGITGIDDNSNLNEFSINTYPNPFIVSTTIKYTVREAGIVKISIYNLLGQEMNTLVNGFQDSGEHEIQFDGEDISSGIYYFVINIGNECSTGKLVYNR